MVDAEPVDMIGFYELENLRMDDFKDLRILYSYAHKIIHIEEASVIELAICYSPMSKAVALTADKFL